MHQMLLRRCAALLAGVGLAASVAVTSTAPAAAASFGVTISVADTSVVVGETITISGKVTPRPSARYVYLQKRAVGSATWKTVKKVHTTSGGTFSTRTGASSDADRYYRIYKPKQGSRKAGRSNSVQVIVDPATTPATPPTIAGVSPASGPLSGGATVTITGTGLAGTTRVTFTPLVARSDTADGSGILPELAGAVTVADEALRVVPPASLGGPHLVKVYTPTTTLTTSYTYTATPRMPTAFEQQVLAEINRRRAVPQTCHRGGANNAMPAVEPVALDETLADLALSHSRDLAARQDRYDGLAHQTWRTSSFSVRFRLGGVTGGPYGEILALSPQGYTASQVVEQWMGSGSGHCESLMSPTWTKAGVGVAAGVWASGAGPQNSIFSNVDFR